MQLRRVVLAGVDLTAYAGVVTGLLVVAGAVGAVVLGGGLVGLKRTLFVAGLVYLAVGTLRMRPKPPNAPDGPRNRPSLFSIGASVADLTRPDGLREGDDDGAGEHGDSDDVRWGSRERGRGDDETDGHGTSGRRRGANSGEGDAGGRGGSEEGSPARGGLDGAVSRRLPADYRLPPGDRPSGALKLFTAGVAMLLVSYLMEAILGVGPA